MHVTISYKPVIELLHNTNYPTRHLALYSCGALSLAAYFFLHGNGGVSSEASRKPPKFAVENGAHR